MFNALFLIHILFISSILAEYHTIHDANCAKTPDWWMCTISLAITNPTTDWQHIVGTEATATIWDNNCTQISQAAIPLGGDDTYISQPWARGRVNKLYPGSDWQADWNVTLGISMPAARELVCENMYDLQNGLMTPPPRYPYRGCASLMPISSGCDSTQYARVYMDPGLADGRLTTSACGMTPGTVVIHAMNRWGHTLFNKTGLLQSGGQQDQDDPNTACICTSGGTCTLGQQGGFCCRCPVQCKSRYFS